MSSLPWDYIAKLVCIGDSGCGKSSLTIRLCEGRFSPHHDVTIGVEFGSRIVPVGPPYSKPAPFLPPSSLRRPSSSSSSSAAAAAAASSSAPAGASASTSTSIPIPDGLPEPPRDTSHVPQKHMKLSLWDTAGQETYKSVTRSYFRGASGALLVFDLSRRQTFEHVTDWLNDLRQIAEPDIVVVLVGNKADLIKGDGLGHGDDEREGEGEAAENKDKDKDKDKDNKREVTRQEAEAWARKNGVMEYVETSAKSGENVENAFMRVAERIYQNIQAGKYDLNDRRSGVKGAAAGGHRQVKLGVGKAASSSSSGGCC